MSEENKAIARRFIDTFRTGDLASLDQLLASNFVDHNPFPDQQPGAEGMTAAHRHDASHVSRHGPCDR